LEACWPFGIADGVPEVTKLARKVLRMGATELKIVGGGGMSTVYDPLDVQEVHLLSDHSNKVLEKGCSEKD